MQISSSLIPTHVMRSFNTINKHLKIEQWTSILEDHVIPNKDK